MFLPHRRHKLQVAMYCMQMCVLILHIDLCRGKLLEWLLVWVCRLMVCVEMSLCFKCIHVCMCVLMYVYLCVFVYVSESMAWHGDEIRTMTVSQVGSVSWFNVLLIFSPKREQRKKWRLVSRSHFLIYSIYHICTLYSQNTRLYPFTGSMRLPATVRIPWCNAGPGCHTHTHTHIRLTG